MNSKNCSWSEVGDDSSDIKSVLRQVQSILEHRLNCIIDRRAENYDFFQNNLNLTRPSQTQSNKPKAYITLRKYVERIFSLYRAENGYHSFKHAAHVVISVDKLIDILIDEENKSRQEEYTREGTIKRRRSTMYKQQGNINDGKAKRRWSTLAALSCIPDDGVKKNKAKRRRSLFSRRNLGQCHPNDDKDTSCTLGLGKDPLIHFALVFAALIHDVDHRGIPNKQLAAERHELSLIYKGDSIAELHSLTLGLSILRENEFADLEELIGTTTTEILFFRKLVADLVLTTDISSPKRSQIVKSRWTSAFTLDNGVNHTVIQLKRQAILEQIILVADIAHTMQEWETFVKWNHNLFIENSQAYHNGQVPNNAKDPAEMWYEDQIGFFNGYVFPLAQRMFECGIFVSNGHEFLKRAKLNCERWKLEGKQVCENFQKLH